MLDVLVADDDPEVLACVGAALTERGHRVTEAHDGLDAVQFLASHSFDLALCDIRMPRLDGMTLLRRIRREAPGTAVVMMTTAGGVSDVVQALRDGATNYIAKPFDVEHLIDTVVTPLDERRALARAVEEARTARSARSTGSLLVANSPAMRAFVGRLRTAASSDCPVLITGEAGAGKQLAARTIHAEGPRREGPLTFVEAPALPGLMAASLNRETFVGRGGRDAWFRASMGGTLVIDGLDELPREVHASLLRVLDEPASQARRDSAARPTGVRVVCLTRCDLGAAVGSGAFLDSLFYALNGLSLHVPALREREGDLCPLVEQLLREIAPAFATPASLSPEAWRALERHPFKGNVRELRWTLEHALGSTGGGEIALDDLPAEVARGLDAQPASTVVRR